MALRSIIKVHELAVMTASFFSVHWNITTGNKYFWSFFSVWGSYNTIGSHSTWNESKICNKDLHILNDTFFSPRWLNLHETYNSEMSLLSWLYFKRKKKYGHCCTIYQSCINLSNILQFRPWFLSSKQLICMKVSFREVSFREVLWTEVISSDIEYIF